MAYQIGNNYYYRITGISWCCECSRKFKLCDGFNEVSPLHIFFVGLLKKEKLVYKPLDKDLLALLKIYDIGQRSYSIYQLLKFQNVEMIN